MTHFDEKAATWDDDPDHLERARIIAKRLTKAIEKSTVKSALEYGSGTGQLSFELKNEFPKIMLMDESLNHVSESYQGKLSNFIKVLCDEFNMTIILVTHQDKLTEYADQIVHFEKEGSELKVINR